MPKPTLIKEQSLLEADIIETMLAGLHEWRSDLSYPESHSDMQGCVRALMKMFTIKRNPLPTELKYECYTCRGAKNMLVDTSKGYNQFEYCPDCKGKGHISLNA